MTTGEKNSPNDFAPYLHKMFLDTRSLWSLRSGNTVYTVHFIAFVHPYPALFDFGEKSKDGKIQLSKKINKVLTFTEKGRTSYIPKR